MLVKNTKINVSLLNTTFIVKSFMLALKVRDNILFKRNAHGITTAPFAHLN